MPQEKLQDFPELSSKLAAPTKKSIFERQKAEAEAKRQREQQETAAVYEDFVKSFDDNENETQSARQNPSSNPGVGGLRGPYAAGPPRRHFSNAPSGPSGRGLGGAAQRSSGPGSLGLPPPSLSKKRTYDGAQASQKLQEKQGLFAFDDAPAVPVDAKAAFALSEDEDTATVSTKTHERAAPQPTLRLSSLPPGTSPAVIKALIPSSLEVTNVRILPPSGPGTVAATERKSLSATATLAKDTPALDIDTAVSALQNRYLGYGFYLSLSRHFSSTAIEQEQPKFPSTSSTLPFGARPIPPPPGTTSFNRGHQSGLHRGAFAPPVSYNTSHQVGHHSRSNGPPTQITIRPPHDLKQLKLIHKTLESLLTHGPEFEALLMTRREVQSDERWAWIWNPRSDGGVYYRWRLYDILTGAGQKSRDRGYRGNHVLFEGSAPWVPPEKRLPFEFTTRLDEVVSDSEYDSSDDDSSDAEGPGQPRKPFNQGNQGDQPLNLDVGTSSAAWHAEGLNYLTPVLKAKFTHLLARLPTSTAKLRRGDVARVTAFAIRHAGAGADEIVQMLVSNVQHPYAYTSANADYQKPKNDDNNIAERDGESQGGDEEKEDTSPASLIGLYCISDILSSSSTSGIRHAWRYRQLFDSALAASKTFEYLGRTEKRLEWGRLKAEKWKRSMTSLLTLWEGWCVFNGDTQQSFHEAFHNPPKTTDEAVEEERLKKEREDEESKSRKAKGNRWKAVDEAREEAATVADSTNTNAGGEKDTKDAMDIDGEPMSDLDGDPMSDIDGELMANPESEGSTNMEGEAVRDEQILHDKAQTTASKQDSAARKDEREDTPGLQIKGFAMSTKGRMAQEEGKPKNVFPRGRGQRPKAEDMFADEDSS